MTTSYDTGADFEFPRVILKNFKWYRKRIGGTWSLVGSNKKLGDDCKYWVNREPLTVEKSGEFSLYVVERYNTNTIIEELKVGEIKRDNE